jgi:hypothetical protein
MGRVFMRTPEADPRPAVAFGLAGGSTAVVAAAFLTAAAVAPGHLAARTVVLAVTVGVVAAIVHDWRACAGVTVLAALTYVGFLVHHDGVLTGNAAAWPYTIVIGFAAIVGRVERRMRRAEEARELTAVADDSPRVRRATKDTVVGS